MVCASCGDIGHNARTCPKTQHDGDNTKRGARDSPRTPGEADKLAKLKALAGKLSPQVEVPPLPGQGATGSADGRASEESAQAENGVGVEAPLTLSAIAGLLKQELAPIKGSINSLENGFSKLQIDIQTQVTQLREEVKTEVGELLVRVAKLEELVPTSVAGANEEHIPESIKAKLKELEEQIDAINAQKETIGEGLDSGRTRTAVFGGFGDAASIAEATKWLESKIKSIVDSSPVDIYCKGEFVGILFAKFASVADRERTINTFRRSQFSFQSSKTWANVDRPVAERAVRNVLFGIKWMLVEWGYTKESLWVDEGAQTVVCGPELVATVKVSPEGDLNVTYGTGWDTWDDFQQKPELLTLVSTASKKFAKAAGKGKDKNKEKGKAKRPGKDE